jgi:hypothetical protein
MPGIKAVVQAMAQLLCCMNFQLTQEERLLNNPISMATTELNL